MSGILVQGAEPVHERVVNRLLPAQGRQPSADGPIWYDLDSHVGELARAAHDAIEVPWAFD